MRLVGKLRPLAVEMEVCDSESWVSRTVGAVCHVECDAENLSLTANDLESASFGGLRKALATNSLDKVSETLTLFNNLLEEG